MVKSEAIQKECEVSDDILKYYQDNNYVNNFKIELDENLDYSIFYCENQEVQEERRRWTKVCNFLIIPIERIQDTTGFDVKYTFYVFRNKDREWFKAEVDASELRKPDWINKIYWALELEPKVTSSYRYLERFIDILLKDEKVKTVVEYRTIGWVQYNNQWVFLHSDGCIGHTNDNKILRSTLKGYKFDCADIDANIAVQKTLEMLDICDLETTLSLFCITLLSILTTPLNSIKGLSIDFVPWLFGLRGYGKTSISSLFTRIYDTPNIIRVDAYRGKYKEKIKDFKDCVLIIDDYGVAKTKERQNKVTEKVEDIIRGIGDRSKLSDETYMCNGLPLITAERFLGVDSNDSKKYASSRDRCFRIEMDNIMNERMKNTFVQEKKEKFLHFSNTKYMSTSYKYYIMWLSKQLNSGFLDRYLDKFKDYSNLISGEHSRYVNCFAHLLTSFDSYLQYAEMSGFISYDIYKKECFWYNGNGAFRNLKIPA